MGRRVFLRTFPLAGLALVAACSACPPGGSRGRRGVVEFGLITDVHQDIMHDGPERLGAFVAEMTRRRVGFIAQLGDFCRPVAPNRAFLEAWNRFPGPRHHVLGNHDMDGGFQRETTVAFYGMPARHYGFVEGGVKFLVLDGNDTGGTAAGYRRYVARDQRAWLCEQLASGHEPVVVFVHQALDHPQGIENQDEVRGDLEAARMVDGAPRVLAVFSGHHHQDWARTLNGIHYIQVNSASYQWLGEAHARESYAPEVHRDHPWIRMTCPYRDPLWARVRLDLRRRVLEIEGRATAWVGLDPWARGVSREAMSPETTRPAIADRTLRWRA